MTIFLKSFALLIRSLPRKLALIIGMLLGKLMGIILIHKKKICFLNMDLAFSDSLSSREKSRIIRKMYVNLGKNIVDFLRIPLISQDNFHQFVTVEGERFLVDAREKRKGVLVITAHYGFWDIIPLFFAFRGYGANLITKDIRNASLNDFWMKYRKYGGVNPIYKKNSSREMISLLKRNESLGFVIDQNMNSRSGIFVDFFGVKACTIDVVAKLSQSLECPVLPIFCIRKDDDTFIIRIEEPVLLRQGKDKQETILLTTQAYTEVLERFIIERPDHWIWMHKRWKTRPEGEESIY
ncbi:MAG: lysophospholipid acyltransferase family protein [Candidatus Aureabacteria bacterium]|nr:lysophospholipid acyltransferase family protein [Candidatus Auribacterota bacterium]